MCAVFVSSFSCVICWRMMTRRRRRLVREAGGVADAGFAGDGGDDGDDGGYCGDDGTMRTARGRTMDECLACLDDFSMRKQRERADGDTRGGTRQRGDGRRGWVVPIYCAVFDSSFTRAGGRHLDFLFISRSARLLPVLPYPYLRSSYRLRPVEALREGRRGVGDMP